MPNPVFHFFDFRLDPARRELVRGGTLIELSSRAFDCLVYLVQHRERAVGRDELISAVWGRADVSDNMLSQTLLRIRRALGENNPEQSAIRTVTKFGYRWVAPTEDAHAPETESPLIHASGAAAHAHAAAPAIAVDAPGARAHTAPGDGTVQASAADEANAAQAAATDRLSAGAAAADIAPAPAAPARRNLLRASVLAAALLALLVAAVFVVRHRPEPAAVVPVETAPGAEADLHALTLVLPVEVHADASWDWLRFGIMDLIANRLREGGVSTLSTRTLYSLLAAHPDIAHARPDAENDLAALSHQRIYVRATLQNGQWLVQLTSVEAQRRLEASASAPEITVSARQAADQLLVALGRTPPASAAASSTVQGLLQRIEVVLLSQRRENALALIEQAPDEVREDPSVRLRQAQLELTVGRFDAARAHAQALLSQFDAKDHALQRVRALNVIAGSYVFGTDAAAAAAVLDEAGALAARADSASDTAYTHELRADMQMDLGDYDAAFAQLAKARLLFGAAGDLLHVAAIDQSAGGAAADLSRHGEAMRYYARAGAAFEAIGARDYLAFTQAARVLSKLELLDNAGALELSAAYWPPEPIANNDRTLYFLIRSRALALAHVGRLSEADTLLARIREQAAGEINQRVRLNAARDSVDVALRRGAYDEAIARARPLLATPLDGPNGIAVRADAAHGLIRALRARGDAAAASAETARFAAWVDTLHGAAAGTAPAAVLRDVRFVLDLDRADDAAASGHATAALAQYAALFAQAQESNVPARTLAVAASYVPALLAANQTDQASTVAGSVALYVDADTDAAWVQAQVYRALGQTAAYEATLKRLRTLAGERKLPPGADGD